jgi:hypothetical protein
MARIASIVDNKGNPQPRPGPNVTARSTPSHQTSSARTSAPSSSKARAPPANPPPVNRVDDDDVDNFPALGLGSGLGSSPSDHSSRTARAPAQVVGRMSTNRPNIGLSFATVVTAEAMGQQDHAAGHARLARDVQRRNPSGRPKPSHSATPQGFTDVVVVRRGGSDDTEVEEAFRRRLPVDIAQAAQRTLNALVRVPPIILRGRWSETVEKMGNFVFRFAGDLPPQIIASYQESLCSHFPASESACVVPTSGWTWVQFWEVDIARREGETEFIYTSNELDTAVRANPCFNNVTFCVTPHWQGNPANFRSPAATVIAAILDPDNSICQKASSEGVCMFGRRIKFVRAGASPSLVQCSRCHEIGHYYSSPKCRWTTSQCYRCGGSHDARDHDFECKKQHKVVGVCDCVPKCILCKNSGHHAREKGCPVRGDFVPPRLPRAAPAEALPAVEDARKSDAIPFTRPKARPAHRGRGRGGKGKGRSNAGPEIPLTPDMVEDICAHNEEELRAYCFCCPSLRVDEFCLLYTNPIGSDALPKVTARGKSAQDVFGECITRKNKGRKFVDEAPPDSFHSTQQLHEFLVRSSGRAHAHLNYSAEDPSESMTWLANMPSDEDAGWNATHANESIRQEILTAGKETRSPTPGPVPTAASLGAAVAEADHAISGWKDIKRNITVHLPEGRVARQTNLDGSLVSLPSLRADRPVREGIQLDPTAGHTEHVMIIGRQAQHVGWSGPAQNQFAALAGPAAPPAVAEDPSEVVPNA